MTTLAYRDVARHAVRSTSWFSVLALSVLIAAVDGFAMISLREAVGFIGRAQDPFDAWLFHTTLQLPLYVLAVWGSFLLARTSPQGWAARHPHLAVGGLAVVSTTLVTVALTAANAVYDYQLQIKEMAGAMAAMPSMAANMQATMQQGVQAHVTSVGQITVVVLAANAVVVAWVAVMRGGRLAR